MPSLRRLLRLTPSEVALLASAWSALAATRLTLSWRGTAHLDAPPAQPGAPGAPSAMDRDEVRRVTWAVTHAARLVPAATCLTQAIAARRLLAQHGVRSDLRIGVARAGDGRMQAHAWLECDGTTILGHSEREYAQLR
jgi:hypothetical protein